MTNIFASKVDYTELLFKANENKRNAFHNKTPSYKTTFSPPKKIEKSSVSSENIKKFLERKEEEKLKKSEHERKKKDELLALRSQDKKALRRVQVMLKTTKSANRSVMADAVDNINTVDTLNGFKQCDEDDYGFVSQEASEFYNKMIKKYETLSHDDTQIQKPSKENTISKEIKRLPTKKEIEKGTSKMIVDQEASKNNTVSKSGLSDRTKSELSEHTRRSDSEVKTKKGKKTLSLPPPLKFDELLRIAEKKQYEPVLIGESLQRKEPEKLMTQKEKAEYKIKLQGARNRSKHLFKKKHFGQNPRTDLQNCDYNSKTNAKSKIFVSENTHSNNSLKFGPKIRDANSLIKPFLSKVQKSDKTEKPRHKNVQNKCLNNATAPNKSKEDKTKLKSSGKNKNEPEAQKSNVSSECLETDNRTFGTAKPKSINSNKEIIGSRELKIRQMKIENESLKRKLRIQDLKIKRCEQKYQRNSSPPRVSNCLTKNKYASKRRILSESEDEDFIDDSSPDDPNNYSKYITEIFGYDKSKYTGSDDEECIESSLSQITKEEFLSAKIGLEEDLEDIRKEKKRKTSLKVLKTRRIETIP